MDLTYLTRGGGGGGEGGISPPYVFLCHSEKPQDNFRLKLSDFVSHIL